MQLWVQNLEMIKPNTALGKHVLEVQGNVLLSEFQLIPHKGRLSEDQGK